MHRSRAVALTVKTLPIPDPDNYKTNLFDVLSSGSQREYEWRRFNTGVSKPSIFFQIPQILSLPTCFPGNLMHQLLINLATLLLDLWCKQPGACDQDPISPWPWAILMGNV